MSEKSKQILVESDGRGRCSLSKVARKSWVYRVDASNPDVLILTPVRRAGT